MSPAGFELRNPSMRTAADPRLRPRGHWDRYLDCAGDDTEFTGVSGSQGGKQNWIASLALQFIYNLSARLSCTWVSE